MFYANQGYEFDHEQDGRTHQTRQIVQAKFDEFLRVFEGAAPSRGTSKECNIYMYVSRL